MRYIAKQIKRKSNRYVIWNERNKLTFGCKWYNNCVKRGTKIEWHTKGQAIREVELWKCGLNGAPVDLISSSDLNEWGSSWHHPSTFEWWSGVLENRTWLLSLSCFLCFPQSSFFAHTGTSLSIMHPCIGYFKLCIIFVSPFWLLQDF